MTVLLLALSLAFATDPAPISIQRVADIYPVLPPPGATKWDPKPLLDAIKASEATFTPKDVYELVDRQVRPDVIAAVAVKAALFYDPTSMVAISVQRERARGAAPRQTVTLDSSSFVQLFEAFSDHRNEVSAVEERIGALGDRRADESQSMYERRARTREEQLVKARGPFDGRIAHTTFAVTLDAKVQERDGCSRSVASWDASAVSFDLFRYAMGTTKASSATVALSSSPTVEKAWFTVDNPRRFEVLGRCGTTGTKARLTLTRTPEGAWSGTAAL